MLLVLWRGNILINQVFPFRWRTTVRWLTKLSNKQLWSEHFTSFTPTLRQNISSTGSIHLKIICSCSLTSICLLSKWIRGYRLRKKKNISMVPKEDFTRASLQFPCWKTQEQSSSRNINIVLQTVISRFQLRLNQFHVWKERQIAVRDCSSSEHFYF